MRLCVWFSSGVANLEAEEARTGTPFLATARIIAVNYLMIPGKTYV